MPFSIRNELKHCWFDPEGIPTLSEHVWITPDSPATLFEVFFPGNSWFSYRIWLFSFEFMWHFDVLQGISSCQQGLTDHSSIVFVLCDNFGMIARLSRPVLETYLLWKLTRKVRWDNFSKSLDFGETTQYFCWLSTPKSKFSKFLKIYLVWTMELDALKIWRWSDNRVDLPVPWRETRH